jgi:hypothetical protein
MGGNVGNSKGLPNNVSGWQTSPLATATESLHRQDCLVVDRTSQPPDANRFPETECAVLS